MAVGGLARLTVSLPLEWVIIASSGLYRRPSIPKIDVMRLNHRISTHAGLLARMLLLALAASLSACSSAPTKSLENSKLLGLLTPYRVEVVQGNVLTTDLVERVKPGMPRAQVRDLLGSPLLTDIFHDNRWDYVFTIRRPGAESQQRRVVIWFEGDAMKSMDVPPDLPSEKEFITSINTRRSGGGIPKLELTEEERKALPIPPKVEAVTPESMGALRTYPPLESAL
jgi:outer membrane protein assembly factor BamE